ncbi:MAG: disulfide bond formation protein DsbA [Alphaproteobacteria bacterium PA3]|nr:MAG: disulfide bond formation protein DsbA [Alphaproteobacteria bacterium PA3]
MSSSPTEAIAFARPVTIDFISDVICPWCYVGFRALVTACVSRGEIPTHLSMRPFELDLTTPKEGADRRARLLAKFGGDEARLKEISQAVVDAGLGVGIAFNFDAIKTTPNTRDCHRLLRWARSAGVEVECAEALFQAYHVEGEDLSQATTLVAIARGLGMDGELVARLLASEEDVAPVAQELEIAQRMGVTGVPTVLFNQSFAVVGAQSVDIFVAALDRAWAEQAAAPEPAASGNA